MLLALLGLVASATAGRMEVRHRAAGTVLYQGDLLVALETYPCPRRGCRAAVVSEEGVVYRARVADPGRPVAVVRGTLHLARAADGEALQVEGAAPAGPVRYLRLTARDCPAAAVCGGFAVRDTGGAERVVAQLRMVGPGAAISTEEDVGLREALHQEDLLVGGFLAGDVLFVTGWWRSEPFALEPVFCAGRGTPRRGSCLPWRVRSPGAGLRSIGKVEFGLTQSPGTGSGELAADRLSGDVTGWLVSGAVPAESILYLSRLPGPGDPAPQGRRPGVPGGLPEAVIDKPR